MGANKVTTLTKTKCDEPPLKQRPNTLSVEYFYF